MSLVDSFVYTGVTNKEDPSRRFLHAFNSNNPTSYAFC